MRPIVLLALVALLGSCGSSGPTLPPAAFGPGLKVVGKDVAPGLYRSEGSPDCSYERLRGIEDKPQNVIIEDDVTGPAIVTIGEKDKAFDSDFCGDWKPISTTPISDVRIQDGTHVIGTDMVAGDYHAPGGKGCHWDRLAGSSGDEVVANDDPVGPAFVIVQPTDQAFRTVSCGEWRQIE